MQFVNVHKQNAQCWAYPMHASLQLYKWTFEYVYRAVLSSSSRIAIIITKIMNCSESFELVEWDKRKPVIAIQNMVTGKIMLQDLHE